MFEILGHGNKGDLGHAGWEEAVYSGSRRDRSGSWDIGREVTDTSSVFS